MEQALHHGNHAGSSGFSISEAIDPATDQCQIIVLLCHIMDQVFCIQYYQSSNHRENKAKLTKNKYNMIFFHLKIIYLQWNKAIKLSIKMP